MPFNFDLIDPDPAHLDGTITSVTLDPDQNPNLVFQTNLPWSIKVDWSITGIVAPALGGDWTLKAFMESIGPGFEGQVGVDQVVSVGSAPPGPPRNYTATINVPAGTVGAGVFKLVTVILYSNLGVPQKMAGYSEGPYLQFYNP